MSLIVIIICVVLVLALLGGGVYAPGYRTSPYYGPSWIAVIVIIVLVLFLTHVL